LLVNVASPPVPPVAIGANVTFRAVLCPGDRVNGKVIPDNVNSVVVELMAETVTLVSPPLVKTTT
jgi:hypothetical protein